MQVLQVKNLNKLNITFNVNPGLCTDNIDRFVNSNDQFKYHITLKIFLISKLVKTYYKIENKIMAKIAKTGIIVHFYSEC